MCKSVRPRGWVVWAWLLLPLLGAALSARGDAPAESPKIGLVVIIVVDQLRADYLSRFAPYFEAQGFRALAQEGAYFTNVSVPYAASETAPGHATIATGCTPRRHGITANKWYLQPKLLKPQQPVEDPAERLVGIADAKRTGSSPRALCASTIGEQMKLADSRTRVFSVSLKDRAAIFLAGRSADGVYWCDKTTGRVVTSTYYRSALAPYVEAMNERGGIHQHAGRRWERLLPEAAYAGTHAVEAVWSEILPVLGSAFPHELPALPETPDDRYSEWLFGTPYGNALVLELAQAVVEQERLGAGPATDLLCVSLSANDYVGHFFGPDSAEVLDITARTDRQLAGWLRFLDERVGSARCLVALTADHGMSSAPRLTEQLHLGGGLVDPTALVRELNGRLVEALGADAPAEPLVLGANLPWVYCAPGFDELDARHAGRLTRLCVDVLRRMPGIERVFTAAELAGAPPAADDLDALLAWRSYHPDRSGRFCLKVAPFWFQKDDEDIAGHAAGFRGDRHVPLLLRGPGVRPGRYHTSAELTDVAVTLAALLGIEPPPQATGRVLSECLRQEPGLTF